MALILNIDTALGNASVCLARDELAIGLALNAMQKDHAAWIHIAIEEMLQDAGCSTQNINAIAVSAGPGSYTGLRIGLSTAKGLCYALNIPLIMVGTLQMMAFAAKDKISGLICPMIDARRMEVFTALYDQDMNEIIAPHALVINGDTFSEILTEKEITFFGDGSSKLQAVLTNNQAKFADITADASHLAGLSFQYFSRKNFSDLAYAEPLYLKEFHSKSPIPLNKN